MQTPRTILTPDKPAVEIFRSIFSVEQLLWLFLRGMVVASLTLFGAPETANNIVRFGVRYKFKKQRY